MDSILYLALAMPLVVAAAVVVWRRKYRDGAANITFNSPGTKGLILSATAIVSACLFVKLIPMGLSGIDLLYGHDIAVLATGMLSEYATYLAYIVGSLVAGITLSGCIVVASKSKVFIDAFNFTLTSFCTAIMAATILGLGFSSKYGLQISITASVSTLLLVIMVDCRKGQKASFREVMRGKLAFLLLGFLLVPSLMYSLGLGLSSKQFNLNTLARTSKVYYGPSDVSCEGNKPQNQLPDKDYACWWLGDYNQKPAKQVLQLDMALNRGNIRAALKFIEWSGRQVGEDKFDDHLALLERINESVSNHLLKEGKRYNKPNTTGWLIRQWKSHYSDILYEHLNGISQRKSTSSDYLGVLKAAKTTINRQY